MKCEECEKKFQCLVKPMEYCHILWQREWYEKINKLAYIKERRKK